MNFELKQLSSAEKADFENAILLSISKFYDQKLPYHNFEHAIRALENGLEILEKYNKENQKNPANRDVVYFSLLFHDAGYHENHEEKGFKTKEEYSAHLAEKYLSEQHFLESSLIQKIKGVILATHKNAPFETVEEKIVRAADLAGMASDYDIFLKNNILLKKEFEMQHKTRISLDEWKEKTKEIINFYLKQDIRLTKNYFDEETQQSIFHKRAKENLKRFLAEKRR